MQGANQICNSRMAKKNITGYGLLHDEINKMSLCYGPYIHIVDP